VDSNAIRGGGGKRNKKEKRTKEKKMMKVHYCADKSLKFVPVYSQNQNRHHCNLHI
jgi:hypothetical protein